MARKEETNPKLNEPESEEPKEPKQTEPLDEGAALTAEAAHAQANEPPKSLALERRVRRYIKPDGTFRKGLGPAAIKQAQEVVKKSGRKITKGPDGRHVATPGWDTSIETRRSPEQQLKERAR